MGTGCNRRRTLASATHPRKRQITPTPLHPPPPPPPLPPALPPPPLPSSPVNSPSPRPVLLWRPLAHFAYPPRTVLPEFSQPTDRFITESRAGSGGMADIFKGTDRETGAPVAIKFLR